LRKVHTGNTAPPRQLNFSPSTVVYFAARSLDALSLLLGRARSCREGSRSKPSSKARARASRVSWLRPPCGWRLVVMPAASLAPRGGGSGRCLPGLLDFKLSLVVNLEIGHAHTTPSISKTTMYHTQTKTSHEPTERIWPGPSGRVTNTV
jgi:hypothetical protein